MKIRWIKFMSLALMAGMLINQTVSVCAIETEELTSVEAESIETESIETESIETESIETESVETESVEAESLETEDIETTSIQETETEMVLESESENEIQSQEGYSENSWRYENGVWVPENYQVRSSLYENAWGYENGYYVNSNGDAIDGAVSKGIDVSTFNGKIDWEKLQNESDIDYAIIRCGYGNDFVEQDDARWSYNVSECSRLGIPFGVYIYSYAMDTKEALSEAEHVLRLIEGYDLTLPIYLDLEDEKYTGTLSNREIADIAETFCTRIQQAGYDVGVYANLYWFREKLTDARFGQWEKWVAQYNYQCDYEGSYGMWQCTSSGKVVGIEGNVDLNFDFLNRGYKKVSIKPVRNLEAQPAGLSKITLRWSQVAGADGYIIYRKIDGEERFTYRYIVNKNNFTDTTAAEGKFNYYRVYPYYINDMGERIVGQSDVYVYAKPGVMPVEHLAAQASGRKRVSLVWQAVQGADGYIIYRQVGSSGKFSYLYIKSGTTYIDNKASDTEYNFYRIYPYYINELGERVVGGSTRYVYAKGILPPVTGLKAKSGSGSVTVSWNKLSGADGYIIYRQIGSNSKFSYRYMVSGTSFTDTTASKEEYNFYRIYPYYMDGENRITTTQSVAYVYGRAR